MKNLKIGDEIYYKNVGYGLTSYEGPYKVIDRDHESIFTEDFDSCGMIWDEKNQTFKFDGGLGLVTYATSIDDEDAIEYIKLCEEETD